MTDMTSSSKKDFKEVKSSHKSRTDEKSDKSKRRKDERNQKKEQTDYISLSNERSKEHNVRHGEKSKKSESRKRSSHVDVKDDRKGGEKPHRGRTTEDTSRKKEHSNDKGSKNLGEGDHDKHKSRRSSTVSSRGRTSKYHSHADNSCGEGSDGSKRKPHSRKRDLSPSPVSATGSPAGASEVYVHNMVTEDGLVSCSSEFEAAIQNGERTLLRVLCDKKTQVSESEEERETCGFLKVMFEDDGTARTKLLTHLGFNAPSETKDTVSDDLSQEVDAIGLEDTAVNNIEHVATACFSCWGLQGGNFSMHIC
ncbi:unnamed protein product [Trifolium pratense]|uniref:Uncharacterized protein n=1 Tax=Trifolium pratense TaxID=57577 RepID=A0ACB0I9V7_TRIPR|nr:unnamed protein product [Trifolium pratense]